MKIFKLSLMAILLASCGDGSVNVDTHGDRIDDHENRLKLVEEVNALQDELLNTHTAQISSLDDRVTSNEGRLDSLEDALAQAIKEYTGNHDFLLSEVDRLDTADAENMLALQAQIDALQLALDANSALDNDRFRSTLRHLFSLDRQMASANRDRASMKREYRAGLHRLKNSMRYIHRSLSRKISNNSSRIQSLRRSLNRLRDVVGSNYDELSSMIDQLFTEVYGEECGEEPTPALRLTDEQEECNEGILAAIDGLSEEIDSNDDDIDKIKAKLRRLKKKVDDNTELSEKNKKKIKKLKDDVDDLEDTDRQLLLSHLHLSRKLDNTVNDLNAFKASQDSFNSVINGKVSRLISSVQSLSARLRNVESDYVTSAELARSIRSAVAAINVKINRLSRKDGNLQDQIDDLEADINALRQRVGPPFGPPFWPPHF